MKHINSKTKWFVCLSQAQGRCYIISENYIGEDKKNVLFQGSLEQCNVFFKNYPNNESLRFVIVFDSLLKKYCKYTQSFVKSENNYDRFKPIFVGTNQDCEEYIKTLNS